MQFLFYDLETSGLKPGPHRAMQFAAILTDSNFKELQRVDWKIKLSNDILPDPEAVLLTGISPQSTQDGLSEAEFLVKLKSELLPPNTIILGYNSIRFDDEFMRYTFWRNFHDPYEWQWKDGRSRFDVYSLTQFMRALRPGGLNWPSDESGNPTNRLEEISKANKFKHGNAHDALSDVEATVELSAKIKELQPKMFDFALSLRDKNVAASYFDLEFPEPVVHISGKIPRKFLQTSVVFPICPNPSKSGGVLVYDLRYDPDDFVKLNIDQIKRLTYTKRSTLTPYDEERVPIKGVQFNKCPMVAPLGVLDEAAWARIDLNLEVVRRNLAKLKANLAEFSQKVYRAYEVEEGKFPPKEDPDLAMYDGFLDNADRDLSAVVRAADSAELKKTKFKFNDPRLNPLLVHYKARNFSKSLNSTEKMEYEAYRQAKLKNGEKGLLSAVEYKARLEALSKQFPKSSKEAGLIQNLQDWLKEVES